MAFFPRYWSIDIELEQMSRYLDFAHSSLQDHQLRFEEFIERQANGLTDEEKDELYDFFSDDYSELRPYFCANTAGFNSIAQTGGISIQETEPKLAKFRDHRKMH